MSMAISIAKRTHRGDSFLGDLGKVAAGFLTAGPAGAAIAGVTLLAKPKSTGEAVVAAQQPMSFAAQPKGTKLPTVQGPMPGAGIQIQLPSIGGPGGLISGGGAQMGSFGPGAAQTGGGFMQGAVPRKRRRMNPLNPRAASRAMQRLVSAKRAASVLNRVTIRKKKCGTC